MKQTYWIPAFDSPNDRICIVQTEFSQRAIARMNVKHYSKKFNPFGVDFGKGSSILADFITCKPYQEGDIISHKHPKLNDQCVDELHISKIIMIKRNDD